MVCQIKSLISQPFLKSVGLLGLRLLTFLSFLLTLQSGWMLGQSVHACWLAWMWNVPHRLMFQYRISRRWHCLGRRWTLPDHTHPSRISHMGLALQAAAASGSSLSCLLPCPFVQMWTSPARGSLPEWPWPLHHAFLITMDPNQRIYLPSSCFCLVLLSQWWENLPRTKPEGYYDVSGYFRLCSERKQHRDDPVYELHGDLPAGRAGNTQLMVPRLHVHWHCLTEPRTPWQRRGLQTFQNGLLACFCWASIQQGLMVNGYECVIHSNRAFRKGHLHDKDTRTILKQEKE